MIRGKKVPSIRVSVRHGSCAERHPVESHCSNVRSDFARGGKKLSAFFVEFDFETVTSAKDRGTCVCAYECFARELMSSPINYNLETFPQHEISKSKVGEERKKKGGNCS